MRLRTRRANLQEREEYESYTSVYENYDKIIDYLECHENEKKFGFFMNDKELRDYIDNFYFQLKDNYERYRIEELYNSDVKEDEGGKFVIIDEDGE